MDPRRAIPSTDRLLATAPLQRAQETYGRAVVKHAVGQAQARARRGEIAPQDVVAEALAALPPGSRALARVINATGIVVHTNLGRAPLAESARQALVDAAGSTPVEYDLRRGTRDRRGRHVLALIRAAAPAAEDVLVVNNNAAALVLVTAALAAGREVVVSKGELVEIGDGFRLPEILLAAGCRLREVGATNRTVPEDYRAALGNETGFVLKVHQANFTVTGYTGAVSVAELSRLEVPVVADLGSGLLRPHPVLTDEPDVDTTLRAGADLVTVSTDKLFGGPQGGLILGRSELVERCRQHPLARALRVDKLTLAALEATLTEPLPPVERMLTESVDSVRERAQVVGNRLSGDGVDCRIADSQAAIGGGGAPAVRLPSAAIHLREGFAAALRRVSPPVVGRVERGECVLDVRTIGPDEVELLCQAVRAAARLLET